LSFWCSSQVLSTSPHRINRLAGRALDGEIEGGADIDDAFCPDPSAVSLDDALHARQANAGTRKLGGRMQPLERLEQLAGVGRVEASAVVADEAADPVVGAGRGSELDGRVQLHGLP
jgi:hypothetical protein